jgi:hypothetical protein
MTPDDKGTKRQSSRSPSPSGNDISHHGSKEIMELKIELGICKAELVMERDAKRAKTVEFDEFKKESKEKYEALEKKSEETLEKYKKESGQRFDEYAALADKRADMKNGLKDTECKRNMAYLEKQHAVEKHRLDIEIDRLHKLTSEQTTRICQLEGEAEEAGKEAAEEAIQKRERANRAYR